MTRALPAAASPVVTGEVLQWQRGVWRAVHVGEHVRVNDQRRVWSGPLPDTFAAPGSSPGAWFAGFR